jgi:hypothetical protein
MPFFVYINIIQSQTKAKPREDTIAAKQATSSGV